MSLDEYASIVAEYQSVHKTDRIDYSRYSKAQIEVMKKAQKIDETFLGLRFTSDITLIKHPEFDYIINLYIQYKSFGTLPFNGCLSEQPNKIIEYFNILRAIQNEEERKANKKQELLNKRRK